MRHRGIRSVILFRWVSVLKCSQSLLHRRCADQDRPSHRFGFKNAGSGHGVVERVVELLVAVAGNAQVNRSARSGAPVARWPTERMVYSSPCPGTEYDESCTCAPHHRRCDSVVLHPTCFIGLDFRGRCARGARRSEDHTLREEGPKTK